MKPSKKPARIWVVEIECSKQIQPTVGVGLTREGGRQHLANWRQNNPARNFRLSSYIREEKGRKQERQLAEYNEVVRKQRERKEADIQTGHTETNHLISLVNLWCEITHREYVNQLDYRSIEVVKDFMDYAHSRGMTRSLAYVTACVNRWRKENDPNFEE